MLTLTELGRCNQPVRHRSSTCAILAALTFAILPLCRLYALQQTFWATNQWPPPNWHFSYTNNAAAVAFTNGTTILSARQFFLQPMTDTSITPPATNTTAFYSNTQCLLTFQISTNATTWYPAQSTGNVAIVVINTNSPMYIGMTNTFFSGSNTLGNFKIRQSTTKQSPGQTLVAPVTGGYMISGFLNVQWEYSFNGGIQYKPASGTAYLELLGSAGTPSSLTLQISQPTAGTVQVCWPTQTNYLYQVQKLSNLAATNWSNLGSLLPGTGSTLCQSYSAVGGSNQFYRVVATNTVTP